jgi:hypothetical protein
MMNPDTLDKMESNSKRRFIDKCAMMAIKEILRGRIYHPTETEKIVLTAYAIAERAADERESILPKIR